jgi:hypothetical protein
VLLLRGQFGESLRMHAYAPVLLVTLVVLGAGLVVRGKGRKVLCAAIRGIEERTAVSVVLLVGLPVYWLLRFVLDASQWHLVVR